MPAPALISVPNEITATWLTEVLQYAGIDGEVDSFTARSIGTGQVGENVRFELSGAGDLPSTVVGKFPSPDPVSRGTGINLGNYLREVHFYRNLKTRVNIQTPIAWYAEADAETHDFVIIMEDLAPGEQGDQLAGCNVEAAALAMTQLAHLHGPAWGDDSVTTNELIGDRRKDPSAMKELYDMVSPGFLDRYRDRLSDAEKEMVVLVGDYLEPFMMNYTGNQTLIHIDYRLDNMMFGGPYPLAVIDWQSLAFGCGLNDASYFTGTSLLPGERAESDEFLLRQYFDTLTTYDVDITWEDCWKYYRHHAPAGLIMAVIASMIVGETERGNDMFMAMASRSAQMCRDLDTIDVLIDRNHV